MDLGRPAVCTGVVCLLHSSRWCILVCCKNVVWMDLCRVVQFFVGQLYTMVLLRARLEVLEVVRTGLIKIFVWNRKKKCSLIGWILVEKWENSYLRTWQNLMGSLLSFYIPYSKRLNNSLHLLKWFLCIFHPLDK